MTQPDRKWPDLPAVYEINTWIWLRELAAHYGHPITLGTVPDEELQRLKSLHFDGVWLMGIWQRSRLAITDALACGDLVTECRRLVPEFGEDDIVGSPYAICGYSVDPALGGDDELRTLRERLNAVGLRLILDFIPNHFARDHAWLDEHPERFVQKPVCGPQSCEGYFAPRNGRWFAHGRDPNLPPWTDTVQVDYRCSGARRAMTEILVDVAGRCDGVRCDMAMLVTRSIFLSTWGGDYDEPCADFWRDAIAEVKQRYPDFLMIAEVYWDLETELQQLGFDYTYDKALRDKLLSSPPIDVRIRLYRDVGHQRRLVRFIENHDDDRCMTVFGGRSRSYAAAVVALTLPGLRLLHDGQLEGRCVRQVVQLGRRCREEADAELEAMYRRLLASLSHPVFHAGSWRLLLPVRSGLLPWGDQHVIAHQWVLGSEYRLVVANLSPRAVTCALVLEGGGATAETLRLWDLLGDPCRGRRWRMTRNQLLALRLKGYGCHIFSNQVPS